MKKLLALLAFFSLTTQAQFGGPPNPEAIARIQPIIELITVIPLMLELDKQKQLGFSKPQAQKLLSLIKPLPTRVELKSKAATQLIREIDKVLNQKQLAWLNDQRLKQQEQRQADQARGNTPPRMPSGMSIWMMFDLIGGKPINPFKDANVSKDLKTLMALLEKR
jgi:hypothetical protein